MVVNAISPSVGLGRKPELVVRTASPRSEAASIKRQSDMSVIEPSSGGPSALSTWKAGIGHLVRGSGERHATPHEVSRWSKTTTDSEISEALAQPSTPTKKRALLKKLKKNKPDSVSGQSTSGVPGSANIEPSTRKIAREDKTISTQATSPVTNHVTGPDEPKSFYDSGSDDSSIASPTASVVQRASSVRVSRPCIVQHSNDSGGSIPKLYAAQSSPAESGGNSLVSRPLNAGHQLQKLHMVNAEPDTGEDEELKITSPGGRQDALDALEGNSSKTEISGITDAEENANKRFKSQDTIKHNVIEYPNTPAMTSATTTLPTPLGGFGSLRVHRRDKELVTTKTTNLTPSSLDGLRSNPPTDDDRKLSRAISAPVSHPGRRVTIRPANLVIGHNSNDSKAFRQSIVSTPYPARQNSLSEVDEPPAQKSKSSQNRSFRRARPLSNQMEVDSADEKDQAVDHKTSTMLLSAKPSIAASTIRSDRFPSPVAPEVLFLDLSLARHPSARVLVEIEIVDKTTFDDEQLFTIIRKTYNSKFYGLFRGLLSARKLSHASVFPSQSSSPLNDHQNYQQYLNARNSSAVSTWHGHVQQQSIDGADFIQHLLRPHLGRRRKFWLLWLRNQQYSNGGGSGSTRTSPSTRRRLRFSQQDHDNTNDSTVSPVFSFMPSRDNNGFDTTNEDRGTGDTLPAVTDNNGNGNGNGNGTGTANAAGIKTTTVSTTSRPPSIVTPRMPFQPYQPQRSKSRASQAPPPHTSPTLQTPLSTSSSNATTATSGISSSKTHTPHGPPKVYLHYTFSPRRILFLLCVTIFLSIFTTTMWILFGLPGRGADQGDGTVVIEGKAYPLSWKRDAQARVVTGLVLGFVALALGCIAEGAWVWASWVLN